MMGKLQNLEVGRTYVVQMTSCGIIGEWTGFGFRLSDGRTEYPAVATITQIVDRETQQRVAFRGVSA